MKTYKKRILCSTLWILLFTVANAQNHLTLLVQQCKPSVFKVITYDRFGKAIASGTGFFINEKGDGITNYHVLAGASSAEIKTAKGNVYKINKIIAQSEKTDLIKFSINNPSKKAFPFLKITQVKPSEGADVFVIGNPEGLDFSVANGIISSVRNSEDIGQIIQTTTPISHGNSGSPLINMNGEVVGIISFTLIEGQNLNFAISYLNLYSLDPVNQLVFPKAKEEVVTADQDIFKRFDWNVTSNYVLNKETTLKFIEKSETRYETYDFDKSTHSTFTLTYEGIIANIDFECSYYFYEDELHGIDYTPILKERANFNYDFASSYGIFISLEKKLKSYLGDTYLEDISSSAGGVGVWGFDTTNDKKYSNYTMTLEEAKSKIVGKSTISHVWKNDSNKSCYILSVGNGRVAWNKWSLKISPVNF